MLRNAGGWVLPPSLRLGDATVTEGDSGTVNAVFTVRLLAGGGQTVTVNYGTANGTAIAGKDYVATSGQLTFGPTDTTKTITVLVNGDRTDEDDEYFVVNLSGATNAGRATSSTIAGTLGNRTERWTRNSKVPRKNE